MLSRQSDASQVKYELVLLFFSVIMTPICDTVSILVSLCHYDQNPNRNHFLSCGRVYFGSVSEHFQPVSVREDMEVGRMWEDAS